MKRLLYAKLTAGLFVVCLALSVLGTGQDSEQAFNGKPLSFWLRQYESTDTSIEPEKAAMNKEAVAAVRSIGTNAIPTLLGMVAKGASWPNEVNNDGIDGFVILGASASNAVPALLKIFEESRSPSAQATAAWALEGIGSAATVAVPTLMSAVTGSDPRIRSFAFAILGRIPASHEQAIPVAAQALSNTNVLVKLAAMNFLSNCGSEAGSAVPALVEQSTNTMWSLRSSACGALGTIHSIPAVTMPALVARLTDPVPIVRKTAARALGKLGTSAREAVPALNKLRNDTNPDVRSAAAEAIEKIMRERI